MTNFARKGNGKELRTASILENDGWITGSRRHRGGAGDLTANRVGQTPLLIEVKATAGGPFERFVPSDRKALLAAAEQGGMIACLAYWAPRARTHRLIFPGDWPPTK